MANISRIAGIDGCKAGWFVVSSDTMLEDLEYFVAENIGSAVRRLGRGALIGIDMPIGIPDAGPRDCDFRARRLLAPRRGASVFPAPVRSVLGVRDYAEACDLREAIDGKRLSLQAFNILPKIDEVDRYIRKNREVRLFEVHPELAFAALNAGVPMVHPKRSGNGFIERMSHLEPLFDAQQLEAAASAYARSMVAKDDVLDAFAVLASARRIASGSGRRVPEQPVSDSAGLDMAIWF
jgi:predicted RNase H-like nuclease